MTARRTFFLAALAAAAAARAATGFFGVENRGDDGWWVVDPSGKDTFVLGVDHVKYEGHWCEKLKAFPHLAEMKKRFPDKEDWRKETVARLRDWGFNTLGAGSNEDLKHRGLAHTTFLSMGDVWAFDKDEGKWICPNERRPCSAFPNVFHPDWPAHCESVAKKACAAERDDPLLFGYFIDNELAWWGRAPEGGVSGSGLFDEAMKRRDGHAAKEAALALLKEKGVDPASEVPAEVKLEFLRRAAERYFSAASAAIRRADPNHLVLGARFAGLSGAHPVVWEVSGKYCDLVTFNCYPWADIDRDIVLNDAWSRKEPVYDAFKRAYDLVKRPLLVTEWSFPALDSGLPCRYGAGQRFRTQKERAEATELFAKSMLAMPFVIGYDYFMWVDEPALGISSAFPEDSNYGLVNNEGVPYPEITSMFRRLHSDLPRWRRGAVAVEGEGYSVCGPDGLLLKGRKGRGPVFDEVSLGGVRYGSFNAMLELADGGRPVWCDFQEVVSAERKGPSLEVVASAMAAGTEFEAALRFSSPDADGRLSAEILSVRNKGARPLVVRNLYFREYADFAGEAPARESVPHLWKGDKSAAWVAKDGRSYGARTSSAKCTTMWYWVDVGPHPDAVFSLSPDPVVLAPGKSIAVDGVWILIELEAAK